MGLARGVLSADGTLRIERATLGSAGESAASTVAGWIEGKGRYVLALDAPLGWPAPAGETLAQHQAGTALQTSAEQLFRRTTDRLVGERLGRTPPEVGADRVAHLAHAALGMLTRVRQVSRRRIPLAWDAAKDSGVIEVLPFATLRAHGLVAENYRGSASRARKLRGRIIDKIETLAELWVSRPLLLEDSHLLEAVIAVVAAADFVRGDCYAPDDLALAKKEGFIWVRKPGQRELFP